MLQRDYPILEFDSDREALINAADHLARIEIPEHCVVCFFNEVIDKLVSGGRARVLTELVAESGKTPVYEVNVGERKVGLFNPGLGAPSAAKNLEKVIALGCNKFIACGGAGMLDRNIQVGHLIIPKFAVRDEGTSYHYLEPSREVEASAVGVQAIEKVLAAHDVPYIVSKTWTTDAFYRSTPEKIRLRKSEGCPAVEKELPCCTCEQESDILNTSREATNRRLERRILVVDVVLDRFHVKSDKKERAREWMQVLNNRIAECRATLEAESMYFEAIFSEERDDEMYLWWLEFKDTGGRPIQESEAEIDRIHLDFWQECIENSSRQVMRTELVLIPEFIKRAIDSR